MPARARERARLETPLLPRASAEARLQGWLNQLTIRQVDSVDAEAPLSVPIHGLFALVRCFTKVFG